MHIFCKQSFVHFIQNSFSFIQFEFLLLLLLLNHFKSILFLFLVLSPASCRRPSTAASRRALQTLPHTPQKIRLRVSTRRGDADTRLAEGESIGSI